MVVKETMLADFERKYGHDGQGLDLYNTKVNEPHSSVLESYDYDFAMENTRNQTLDANLCRNT